MMSTSSFDSESLVRRHVCGLWASLWLGSFGGLLTNLGLSDRCRHRGGWLGGCLVGCCPKILGLSDRCRHRGGWLGVVWGVVVRRSWGYRTAAGTAADGWGPGGLLSEQLGLSDRCRHRGRWLGLPAPRPGGLLTDLELSDRCLHRGRWLGAWTRVIGPLPAPRGWVVGGCRHRGDG